MQYAWNRHDRITALAALTRAPWAERFGLYYSLLDHNARTADVARFLQDVHHHVRRSLLLVCDRWSVHRAAVKKLQHNGAGWLTVDWLPAYAPELDPVENVWDQSKYGELANFIPDDIEQMRDVLDALLLQFRHDPERVRSFFRAAHLIP